MDTPVLFEDLRGDNKKRFGVGKSTSSFEKVHSFALGFAEYWLCLQDDGSKLKRAPSWRKKFRTGSAGTASPAATAPPPPPPVGATSVSRSRDGTTVVKVLPAHAYTANNTVGLNGGGSLGAGAAPPGSPPRRSATLGSGSFRERREGSVDSATASCISKRT